MAKKAIPSAFVLLILLSTISFAQNVVTATNMSDENRIKIVAFVGDGCPHCADLEDYLASIEPDYPELEVVYYEVWSNQTNSKLMKGMARSYGVRAMGVPLYFIGNKAISGFSDSMIPGVKERIDACRESRCIDPMDRLSEQPPSFDIVNILIWVFVALVIIIAVAFLIKYIVEKKKKR